MQDRLLCKHHEAVFTFGFAVYSVESCPAGFFNQYVASKCEQPDSSDVINVWPVTDSHGVLYTNIFCAICNDVSGVRAMNPRYECRQDFDQTLLENATSAYEVTQILHENRLCDVLFEHTGDVIERLDAGARVCKPLLASCPLTWSDDCTRDLCESEIYNDTFSLVYDNSERVAYRNVFCAQCRGKTGSVDCQDRFTIVGMRIPTQVASSHAVLLHCYQSPDNPFPVFVYF